MKLIPNQSPSSTQPTKASSPDDAKPPSWPSPRHPEPAAVNPSSFYGASTDDTRGFSTVGCLARSQPSSVEGGDTSGMGNHEADNDYILGITVAQEAWDPRPTQD